MKSDLPDLPVTMKLDNVAKRQFTIDKTWKRYIIENVVPAGNSNSRCIINNDSDGGTLWIDDVQLECSTVATDYKPADTDKDLTGRAVHCVSRPADCPIVPGADTVSVSIDSYRRFLVDGKPFIPYAMACGMPSPEVMRTIAKAGLNTVCFCVGDSKTVADIRNVLDNAKANGLKVIPWFSGSTAAMRNLVAGLKDRPAVIAWYVSDEPNTDAEKAVALERYNAVKQIDPSGLLTSTIVSFPRTLWAISPVWIIT